MNKFSWDVDDIVITKEVAVKAFDFCSECIAAKACKHPTQDEKGRFTGCEKGSGGSAGGSFFEKAVTDAEKDVQDAQKKYDEAVATYRKDRDNKQSLAEMNAAREELDLANEQYANAIKYLDIENAAHSDGKEAIIIGGTPSQKAVLKKAIEEANANDPNITYEVSDSRTFTVNGQSFQAAGAYMDGANTIVIYKEGFNDAPNMTGLISHEYGHHVFKQARDKYDSGNAPELDRYLGTSVDGMLMRKVARQAAFHSEYAGQHWKDANSPKQTMFEKWESRRNALNETFAEVRRMITENPNKQLDDELSDLYKEISKHGR